MAFRSNIIGTGGADGRRKLTALQNVAINNSSTLLQSQSSQFQNVIMHEGNIIFCGKNIDTSTSTIEVVEILSSSDTLNGMHQNQNNTKNTQTQ